MTKISYAQAKKIKAMNQKQLTIYSESLYRKGYEEGYRDCQMQKGDTIDFELLKVAIKATEGIGKKRADAIINNINNLCFEKEGVASESSNGTDTEVC